MDCRHLLRRQARSRPACPNPDDPDRGFRERREGDRHAEELTASLAVAPVDLDHDAGAFIRCRTTLSTSTNANAVNEMRTVSSQSRSVSGSVSNTACRNGVQMTATWRAIDARTARISFGFVNRPICQI